MCALHVLLARGIISDLSDDQAGATPVTEVRGLSWGGEFQSTESLGHRSTRVKLLEGRQQELQALLQQVHCIVLLSV